MFESDDKFNKSKLRSSINLIWIGILFTIIIDILMVWGFSFYYSINGYNIKHMNITLILYGISCIIECLSEPFIVKYIISLNYSITAFTMAPSLFIRHLVSFAFLYLGYELLAYGFAQLVFAVIMLLTAVIYAYIKQKNDVEFSFRDFFPKKIVTK